LLAQLDAAEGGPERIGLVLDALQAAGNATLAGLDHVALAPGGEGIMAKEAGRATRADGRAFVLGLAADGAPLVRSAATGRTFGLRWTALVGIAVAMGCDAPAPTVGGHGHA
jgi:hypothetical protein